MRQDFKKPWASRPEINERLKGVFSLAVTLPKFFRERITIQEAGEEIKRALDQREETFIELARTRIYDHSTSPYLKLLTMARCEFADLRAHVRLYGLEATLERIAREGVYLTSDEFKGKKEVVRGGESFRVSPSDFQRADFAPGLFIQSSGTKNRPTRSLVPLDWLTIRTFGMGVFLSAHHLLSHSHAMYDAILPGAAAVNHLLTRAKLGVPTERWFARKIPVNTWLEGEYHSLTTRLIVLMAKWFGPGFPTPEFRDIDEIRRVVDWASAKSREGTACCVTTVPSNAARIAQAAWDMGVSLGHATFHLNGEPLTDAKRKVIQRVGAAALPLYASNQEGFIGHACANPVHPDEVHLNHHMLAVTARPSPLKGHGEPNHPLLFTTLHRTFPTLLLNVENGDCATVEKRDCGCALGKVGLILHLHHIRSYEKFTSEGMNYFYGDLYELFEKIFPSEFGGGPGDYQLREEEDEHGQTRVTLVVHPGVGELSEERLLERLRIALSDGSRANRFMAEVWRSAGTLRVRRETPHASARGKILPLHIPH